VGLDITQLDITREVGGGGGRALPVSGFMGRDAGSPMHPREVSMGVLPNEGIAFPCGWHLHPGSFVPLTHTPTLSY
jgi:hypothetical protein